MLFTVTEAAREACMRISEILDAIEDEDLESVEGPEGETLIQSEALVEFIESRRTDQDDEEESTD